MTWHELAGIEKQALDVIHYMATRLDHPLQVNMHVISSLAGTTGRGCWSLVAFKIREMLLKEGIVAHPTGILFDAMVFAELFPRDCDFALRCKVNSLTGLSEFSCWENNKSRERPICFDLPGLSHAQSELCDLIRTDGDQSLSKGPVDELTLIREDPHESRKAKDYFKNAADALYMVTASRKLAAGRINDNRPFSSSSVGSSESATFEVNVADIDNYCSTRAYDIALAGILDCDEDVSPTVAKFFETLPINTTIGTIGDIRPRSDGQGSLFQRLSFELVRQAAALFEDEKERLPRIGREEALDMTGAIIGKTTARHMEEALKKALISLGFADGGRESVSAFVEDFAMRVFSGDQGRKCSIGRLRNFLKVLHSDVAKSLANPEKIDPPETAVEAIARFSKRTFQEILLHRPRFNAEEIATLIRNVEGGLYAGIIVDQFLSNAYGEMLRVVRELVACVQKKVHSLISVVDRIEEVCIAVRRDQHDYGFSKTTSVVEAFNDVFVLPDRCLEAIVDEGQNGRSRILKPIVESVESVDSLIGEHLFLHSGLDGFLKMTVGRLLADDQLMFDPKQLERELFSAINSNVSLQEDFIESNFAFLKVLARNRDYWNEEIKRVDETGDAYRASAIDNLFLKKLGAVPERDVYSIEPRALPTVEELKYTIIDTFLVRAQPCKERDWKSEMTVFVPFMIAEEKVARCKERLSCKDNTPVEIIDLEDDASSPYAYLAYVEARVEPQESVVPDEIDWEIPDHEKPLEGPSSANSAPARPYHVFDAFKSLGYYRDEKVLEKLKEVEREDGKPIFDPNPALGPIGYVSPIYVRDKEWSSARWKPWVDGPSKS